MVVQHALHLYALPRGLLHPHLGLADLRTAPTLQLLDRHGAAGPQGMEEHEQARGSTEQGLARWGRYLGVRLHKMARQGDGVLLWAAPRAALLGNIVNLRQHSRDAHVRLHGSV